MNFRDSALGRRLTAAIFLLIGVGSLIFQINWLDSLFGISTYFFLPGLFLSLLLGLAGAGVIAAIGFGLILSPAMAVIVLYITINFAGLELGGAETAVALIGLMPAVAVLIHPRPPANPLDNKMPPPDRWFYLGILFLAFLLTPLLHPGNQNSFHGLFHTSIVHAIQNGFIPPPNPGFYGEPVNTYWHFHLFLAAVIDQAHVSAFIASVLLRASSLLSSYLVGGLLVRVLLKQPNPWLVTIFAIFCINLAGPILVIADIPGSDRLPDLINGNMSHPTKAVRAILFGEHRTASGLSKFLNFNAFCYILAMWTGSLVLTLDKQLPTWVRSTTFFIIGAAAISFHVPSSPAFLILFPAAISLELLIHREMVFKVAIQQIGATIAPFVLALLIWLPYWLPVLSSHDVSSVNQGAVNLITNSQDELIANLKLILGTYWPLLPLLIIALFMWRQLTRTQTTLLVIAFGSLGLSLLLQVLDGNQYKFTLLAAVPVGISAVVILELLGHSHRKLKRVILIVGIILAMLNSSFYTIGHLRSAWWNDTTLFSSGENIEYTETGAYAFVREYSEKTAVIVEAPTNIDKSLVGAVGRRNSFFRKSTFGYYNNLPTYDKRKTLVEQLFTPGTEKQQGLDQLAQTIDTEVYLLLDRDRLKGGYGRLKEELTAVPTLQIVFSDANGAVFKLK